MRALILTIVTLVLAACTVPAAAPASSVGATADAPTAPPSTIPSADSGPGGGPPWESAPARPPALAVDNTLTPVSASDPDAKEALTLCGALTTGREFEVEGMARLKRADMAPLYARLPSTTPELQRFPDSPAWLIQFQGERIEAMSGESWIDATCMVIGSDPFVYATGPVRSLATGKISSGYYEVEPGPKYSLPPLAP